MFERLLEKLGGKKPLIQKTPESQAQQRTHVEWAKDRARECLERGDLKGAINSLISDLRKEDVEVRGPNPYKRSSRPESLGQGLLDDPSLDATKVKEFIDNFSE